jgi:putative ABC transport system substrate-binding protein
MNNRRKLVIALGAGTIAAPFSSFAQQQGKVWRIGFLWERTQSESAPFFSAFKAGMSTLGYTEGKNYVTEHRSAQLDLAQLPVLAADLVATKVDLMVTSSTPATHAASKVTREIPVIFVTVGDPVASGFAASLAHPGGNLTGVPSMTSELVTKRLDLLRQLLPHVRRVGLLYDADNQSNVLELKQFEADCAKLHLQSILAPAHKAGDIPAAFKVLASQKAHALIVTGGGTTLSLRKTIIEFAAKHHLPAVYARSDYAVDGGLLSYAANYEDMYRLASTYADKIFKGAKAGDIPIDQPIKFDFLFNMKTAKALGLKVPNSILVQATKVIE